MGDCIYAPVSNILLISTKLSNYSGAEGVPYMEPTGLKKLSGTRSLTYFVN